MPALTAEETAVSIPVIAASFDASVEPTVASQERAEAAAALPENPVISAVVSKAAVKATEAAIRFATTSASVPCAL